MKLTTISTLGVVVALATASLLQGNDGLAETASRRRRLTNTTTNTTASFNATAVDLLSDAVSVFLVVGYILLEATCLCAEEGTLTLCPRHSCSLTRHIISLSLAITPPTRADRE